MRMDLTCHGRARSLNHHKLSTRRWFRSYDTPKGVVMKTLTPGKIDLHGEYWLDLAVSRADAAELVVLAHGDASLDDCIAAVREAHRIATEVKQREAAALLRRPI